MSWHMHILVYRDGEPAEFETEVLHGVFQQGALADKGRLANCDYVYDDGQISFEFELSARSTCLVVRRVFGRTALARMMEAASVLQGMIFWAAEEGAPWAAITTESARRHLPPDLGDMNPAPVLVSTVDEFIDAVGFSTRMTKAEWEDSLSEYNRWHERHEAGSKYVGD